MMPTFDFGNLVRRVIVSAVKTFGGRLPAALAFATGISTALAIFDFGSWLSDYLPQIPSVYDLISVNELNQDIFELFGYAIAADVIASGTQHFFSFLNFIVRFIPSFMVSIVLVVWVFRVTLAGAADLKDQVS